MDNNDYYVCFFVSSLPHNLFAEMVFMYRSAPNFKRGTKLNFCHPVYLHNTSTTVQPIWNPMPTRNDYVTFIYIRASLPLLQCIALAKVICHGETVWTRDGRFRQMLCAKIQIIDVIG